MICMNCCVICLNHLILFVLAKHIKIKHNTLLNLSIPGYKFLNVNSLRNARGAGVFISDILHCEKIPFDHQFSGCEHLWIRFKCPNSNVSYVIGTIFTDIPPQILMISRIFQTTLFQI